MANRKLAAAQAAVIRQARELRAGQGTLAELSSALDALDALQLPDPDAGHGRWVEGSADTSRHAALTLPRGCRRDIVMQVACAPAALHGLTDDELERRLKRPHQTVSAARNHLVSIGWLQDSGKTRIGRNRRPKVVWTLTPAGVAAVRGAS